MGEIIVAVFGIYLILQMIIGYRRGLIKSMLNLASWILTFAIAYKGAAYFKEIVIQNVPEIQGTIVTDRIAYMIAYMGLMIVCKIIFSVVIRFANKVTRVPGVGFINKVAGAALGLIKGSLIIMVVVFFISLMPHVGMESEYAQIVGGSEVMQTMASIRRISLPERAQRNTPRSSPRPSSTRTATLHNTVRMLSSTTVQKVC